MTRRNKVMTAGGILWLSYRFHSQRRRNLFPVSVSAESLENMKPISFWTEHFTMNY